jgi:hypothetical protein
MSPFYTHSSCYMYNNNTDEPPSQEFPAVPYGPLDFHCDRELSRFFKKFKKKFKTILNFFKNFQAGEILSL